MGQPLAFFLEQTYPYAVTPDPDGGYFISYPDLPGCVTQVETFADIGPAAEEIRALWLETAYDHGMDIPLPREGEGFSGKFLVRLPRSLHRRLARSAEQEGVSLNQYVISLLATNDAVARIEHRLAHGEPVATPDRDSRERSRHRASLSVVGSDLANR